MRKPCQFISVFLVWHLTAISAHLFIPLPSRVPRAIPLELRGGSKQQKSAENSLKVRQHLIAGGISRAIAQMSLYPIDALRTLAQTRDGRTLADVGASALIRGCTTTSTFALFMGSIQFGVNGFCRKTLQLPIMVSSALAAAGSCVVGVPQEVIKQRLVTGVYTDFSSAVSTIWKTEGLRGFYSAWRPTMGRNVPFVMTTFTTMDLIQRKRRQQARGDSSPSTVETICIGMTSALVGGLVTQPMDVVKTRLMTQAASTATPYTGAANCFFTMLRQEGPFSLYAGFKQRSTYMCLLWGTTFALNGYLEGVFTKRNQRQVLSSSK